MSGNFPGTKSCKIYEFSERFNFKFKEKNSLWVSGGYLTDETKKFGRTNFPGKKIPDVIRQALAYGKFEIPSAYPPVALTDEKFKDVVENGQYNLANPELKYKALIARDLGDYCVLAVATRQVDDGWRKVIGYRYFCLKKSEIKDGNTLLDGIAMLLIWWEENQYPCFDMNPNQDQDINHVIDYNYYNYKQKSEQKTYQNQLNWSSLDQAQLPLVLYKNGQTNEIYDYWDIHQLATQACLSKGKSSCSWAWNVRDLEKPKEFTVICCADQESYAKINGQNLSPSNVFVLLPARQNGGSGSAISDDKQHQKGIATRTDNSNNASGDISSHSTTSNKNTNNQHNSGTNQEQSDTSKKISDYLQQVADRPQSEDMRELIKVYQDNSPGKETNESTWKQSLSSEIMSLLDAKMSLLYANNNTQIYEKNIRYTILVIALFINIPEQGQSNILGKKINAQELANINEKYKEWAREFLKALLANLEKYSYDQFKQTVDQLKSNIKKLQTILSNKDETPNSNPQHTNIFDQLKELFGLFITKKIDSKISGTILTLLVLFGAWLTTYNHGQIWSGNSDSDTINVSPSPSPVSAAIPTAATPSSTSPSSNTDENLQKTIDYLTAHRDFIKTNRDQVLKCDDNSAECQTYQETKNFIKSMIVPEMPKGLLSKTREKSKDNIKENTFLLQQSLSAIYDGEINVGDGNVFTDKLEQAVKRFQKEECGEDPDGKVGGGTWACLSKVAEHKQVLAVLDYKINHIKKGKNLSQIEKKIQSCKTKSKNAKDFIDCLKN